MERNVTSRQQIFNRDAILNPAQIACGVTAACLCLSFACAMSLKSNIAIYNASAAWCRAFAFFGACFTAAWITGVLDAVFFRPYIPHADQHFQFFTAACLVVVLLGYWVIWPRGTISYGRKLHLPCCILFGLCNGLAEAQLFLVVWALVELVWLPRYATTFLVLLILAAFKANWNAYYWNRWVVPAHNIGECNKWKVLFVHVPNILLTLPYFMLYGSAVSFVCIETLAFIGSTCAMKFPPPWSDYTNPPDDELIVSPRHRNRSDNWLENSWRDGLNGKDSFGRQTT